MEAAEDFGEQPEVVELHHQNFAILLERQDPHEERPRGEAPPLGVVICTKAACVAKGLNSIHAVKSIAFDPTQSQA